MEKSLYPTDQARVLFTDMQGIQREGIYKKDSNGYVEINGKELPEDPGYVIPEEDVVAWEYTDKNLE